MANKRMISLNIVDSDSFMEMPQSTQVLYFHLCLRADDDGFIDSPKKIMRMVGCKDDDLKLLITKKYAIPFESGVIVITHWKIHNTIQKDRYHKTRYQEEYKQLKLKNNEYFIADLTTDSKMETDCIQDVSKMETEIRLDKIRLDKNRLDKNRLDKNNMRDCDEDSINDKDAMASKQEVQFLLFWNKCLKKDDKYKEDTFNYWMQQNYDNETINQIMIGIDNYNKDIADNRDAFKYAYYPRSFLEKEIWKQYQERFPF